MLKITTLWNETQYITPRYIVIMFPTSNGTELQLHDGRRLCVQEDCDTLVQRLEGNV